MTVQSYYRAPWTKDKVDWLTEWWPHFGTYACAQHLGLTRQQVKGKVDKMGLTLLAKTERLCVSCKTERQVNRRMGLKCRGCALSSRKDCRRSAKWDRGAWLKELVRTIRHRSAEPSDVDVAHLEQVWTEQSGRCYYSGVKLDEPRYGCGRRMGGASVDRKDSSRGYVKGNVVWASWACNAGKSDMSAADYVEVCRKVAALADRCARGEVLLKLLKEQGIE